MATTSALGASDQTRWARLRSWMRANAPACIAVYVLFFALIVALQIKSGTYGSEFGHDPDEPGLVVSSLMVHDYIATEFPGSPMRYAETYYLHYPKVALGVWP